MVTQRKRTRVLVVDDSMLFRNTLSKKLDLDPNIEVIGSASNAMEAMTKITDLRPDVVTLDVEMPKMSGIEFLKQLMPKHPVPVVVVSSAPITALDALDAGAVDFVKKPVVNGPNDLDQFVRDLIVKIKIASIARVGPRKAPPAPTGSSGMFGGKMALNRTIENMVIAIGASTGGTEAIVEVVKDLPANTPGIVIVQHMPPVFTRMYAQRLDRICKMHVKEAEDGDRVEHGKIIIGAGEFHLRLAKDAKGYFVSSRKGDRVSGHCPSVDVLFESVAKTAKGRAMGVILTGMGADGAKGLLEMRKAGAYTVGQDKESCIVYGMPMVAFNIGGVVKQFSLDQIGGEIIRHLNSMR